MPRIRCLPSIRPCRKCGAQICGTRCEPCHRAGSRAYRAKNLEKAREASRAFVAANRASERARVAAYKLAHPDRVRASKAAYAKKNSSAIVQRVSAWRKANPAAKRTQSHNYRARRRSSGKLSSGLADRLWRLQRGLCACCGLRLGDDYQMDHIMPLAKGGENVDSNIQLLRKRCNRQKSAKHPLAFMQERGKLL